MIKTSIRLRQVIAAFFLCALVAACQQDGQVPSVAEETLQDLQQKYDELVKEKANDPVQWASDDLENIGDWDYEVQELPFDSPGELAAQLNEYGNERWEVIWLERTPDGFLVVLKKPSISYLSKIPLSQLGKFVIGGPESGQ